MSFALTAIFLFFILMQGAAWLLPALLLLVPIFLIFRKPSIQVYTKSFTPGSDPETTRKKVTRKSNPDVIDGQYEVHEDK